MTAMSASPPSQALPPGVPGPARDLVVAYTFPPYVDPSAVVAAKRVREAGRPVDVLLNALGGMRRTDPMLDRIAGDLVVRRYEVPSPSHFASWASMSRFAALGLQQALAWDREGPGYERVYSRAQLAASHLLAARFALLRPEVAWTAEFSDPLSLDADGRPRRAAASPGLLLRRLTEGFAAAGLEAPRSGNAFEWAEAVAYAFADTIVFTNPHQRDLMLSRIEDDALRARAEQRAEVSPHPTLPPEFYALHEPPIELDPSVRHLAYFGSFYASRGLGTVLAALEGLPETLRERLHLHVFTSDRSALDEEVARRGLGRAVTSRPYAGYLDFLALSRQMDVLVVNDAVTVDTFEANPYLPSKWSDYRGSGRPVWGLVEPGSSLDRQPLDHRSSAGHVTAAVQVLARLATS